MEQERPGGTDAKLRDVLDTLAAGVPVSDDAYHGVRAEWTRRQRRRRRLAVVVATVIVLLADVIGLWALNRADSGGHLIFDERQPSGQYDEEPVRRVGQP